jgi:hypothetical protein
MTVSASAVSSLETIPENTLLQLSTNNVLRQQNMPTKNALLQPNTPTKAKTKNEELHTCIAILLATLPEKRHACNTAPDQRTHTAHSLKLHILQHKYTARAAAH